MSIIECPEMTSEAVIKRRGYCNKYSCECWNRLCRYWVDNTKLVYLAFAIDNSRGEDKSLMTRVINYLGKRFTIFNPRSAFSNTLSTEAFISGRMKEINDFVISKSDLLVAVWSPDIPSVGVPLEIDYALRVSVPVVVVCNNMKAVHRSIYFNSFIERGVRVVPADSFESQMEKILEELR